MLLDFFGDSSYFVTRLFFQRALAFLYLIGFLIVVNQFTQLVGEKGILPAQLYLKQVKFLDSPSVFHFHYSDRFALILGWIGVALAVLALLGISERYGFLVSILVWAGMWALYLSFLNIGQLFYGYGWEILLLETGFLAIFLGPVTAAPSTLVIWLLRWVLFRLMFGAGMIKLRGDECWRDFTCMYYHYETQPLPNPFSWYFHFLPKWLHKFEVGFTHFVELLVPIGYFSPGKVGWICGLLTIVFQFTLILSGNLSWLNVITIVLAISCFDDRFFSWIGFTLKAEARPYFAHQISVYLLTALILYLSYRPVKNLFSDRQMMNASFDSFYLVNTYGAFGSITRERRELIIEGTSDDFITTTTQWKPYEFKGKPGDISRMPSFVTPYHYKIDWQMWFAAMSPYYENPWIFNVVAKILKGDTAFLSLLAKNPFPEKPPKYLRIEWYLYHYNDEKNGNWWKREYISPYLRPVALDDPDLQRILHQMEW